MFRKNPTKNTKRALITGIAGQDGTYLAKFLAKKGYFVFGFDLAEKLVKWPDRGRKNIKSLSGSLKSRKDIRTSVLKAKPDEIYNLAAISDLGTANKFPKETMAINFLGFKVLVEEAIKINLKTRIFQASSSEMFKRVAPPQDEETPLEPRNTYADAKIKAYKAVQKYKKQGFFVCSAFLFNHESPLRETRFVTRKITSTLTRIKNGSGEVLELGNLDAKRDWGFAGDYVEAMWLMLQQKEPQDFVIATGKINTVREFVHLAVLTLGLKLKWHGKGIKEKGYDQNGNLVVQVNKNFYRSPETVVMRGNIKKAKKILAWAPRTSFRKLVDMMVENDPINTKKI